MDKQVWGLEPMAYVEEQGNFSKDKEPTSLRVYARNPRGICTRSVGNEEKGNNVNFNNY